VRVRNGTGGTLLRRQRGATITLYVVIGILAAAFFRLQVLRSTGFELRSEANRLRTISIPSPRGAIYDRHGRVLAENVPGYSVSVLPGTRDSVRAVLDRLAPYLDLSEGERTRLMERLRAFPRSPLHVHENTRFDQVSAIEERRPQFRSVVIKMRPQRRYPIGAPVAHAIGYVGEISEKELTRPEFRDYEPERIVGRTGVEKFYEATLAGTPGVRYMVVDARGSIVREFGARPMIPPTPGTDLTLGLDLNLQLLADSLFPADHRGGVVALDPRTGEILLLYSHPSFDPNLFVGGISSDAWEALRDDPAQPLLDRAVSAAYPPGSTWKLVVATLAMRSGVAAIDTHMPTPCRGALRYGRRAFRCWRSDGHGDLDLSGAIKESCNVFFYQLGLKLGLDPLLHGVTALGFNGVTGVDLPFERAGSFPPDRGWYDERFGRRGWTESVVLNLSIGQGEAQQTLLRMVEFYTALATGKPPIIPHLARDAALEKRRVQWSLDLPESGRRDLARALTRVVNEPGGTAYRYRLEKWTLAGKTGTAQNSRGEPHSWFVGFAPVSDPRIVVAAIVEHGHPDNRTSLAVPLAARIVRDYLERNGVPASPPLAAVASADGTP